MGPPRLPRRFNNFLCFCALLAVAGACTAVPAQDEEQVYDGFELREGTDGSQVSDRECLRVSCCGSSIILNGNNSTVTSYYTAIGQTVRPCQVNIPFTKNRDLRAVDDQGVQRFQVPLIEKLAGNGDYFVLASPLFGDSEPDPTCGPSDSFIPPSLRGSIVFVAKNEVNIDTIVSKAGWGPSFTMEAGQKYLFQGEQCLFSAALLNEPPTPYPSMMPGSAPIPGDQNPSANRSSGVLIMSIIGGVVGGVGAAVAVIVVVYLVVTRDRSRQQAPND